MMDGCKWTRLGGLIIRLIVVVAAMVFWSVDGDTWLSDYGRVVAGVDTTV